jgi:ATP-dependent Clp protease ATP-binding subunit ClpC
MFDRFTDDARKALFFARFAAWARHGEQMELEDLVAGIMRAAPSAVVRFASDESALPRGRLTRRTGERATVGPALSVEMPFSAQFKLTLERSVAEADALGHDAIRPEHLVLGLLRDEGTSAWHTLHRAGVRLREVRRMLEAEPEASAGSDATGHD